ncbi:flavodoxin-dependent (E)-4-hydroxy-3-methylbut-2-enyl-diphosphate synthase [bacterium]|nr:flavodoxin-dependent (E)-4-hydroxy-3-methylbut-2-enyl-diphosphate synthase [bacterium]
MIKRRQTRAVQVGAVTIGGGAPVSVQTMVKVDSHDVEACVRQILQFEQAGAQIVRIGFLDLDSVRNISAIKSQVHVPLVADIHFEAELALEAIRQGIDKLRINPGNIGSREKVEAVVTAARAREIPIRIGVNAGSLQKDILARFGHPTPEALVESAVQHIQILEDLDFHDIVVSLKMSDVPKMVRAYQLFSERFDYPLHVGVTEAGPGLSSTVKSSMGIGSLLLQGIGDTIRVSMTGDGVDEVKVGREILKHLGLRQEPILISCPTCSRTQWDLLPVAERVQAYLEKLDKPLKVAVMGCAVNGPGEAREADIGIAGGKGMGIIFVHGQVVATLPQEKLYDELIRLIEEM